MIVLTRTCFCLPLRWGAVAIFVFATLTNIIPLTSLPDYIDKISFGVLLLNACQIAFGVFAGVFALIGTIKKRPHYLLPFLSYYLGYVMLDFFSLVFTIVLHFPFFAHNLLKGAGLPANKKGKRRSEDILVPVIVFGIILFLRSYFTFIVFSYYRELNDSVSDLETSPEISEESLTPNIDNGTTKRSTIRSAYVLVNDT